MSTYELIQEEKIKEKLKKVKICNEHDFGVIRYLGKKCPVCNSINLEQHQVDKIIENQVAV